MRRFISVFTCLLAPLLTTTCATDPVAPTSEAPATINVDTAPPESTAPALTLAPCGEQPGIECGTLEVWEDRAAASGRKIGIFVKVLRATGPNPAPDPLFYFAGGPGGSVSTMPPQAFTGILARRDVVLVDQRGTGQSHPLTCPGWTKTTPEKMLALYLKPSDVEHCRDELSKIADLRHYHTANFIDDVNDVRHALGYDKINLHGGSYGTRPVQVFLRRHPEHARAAVLHGVVGMDGKYPLGAPFAGQQSLDGLIAACNSDESCKKRWGDPSQRLQTVLTRFASGPISVTWQGQSLTLHRETMMEGLRHLMYQAGGTVLIPRILHQAAVDSDYSGLLKAIFQFEGAFTEGEGWFSGLWLSVSCSEDAPWITAEELQRAEQTTVFGQYRPQRHVEACKLWPKGAIPAGFHEPVVSATPALLISGALDPATAPQNGDAVAKHLSNSLHVVVREGHSPSDWGCNSKVVEAFVESGTIEGLDTSCLSAVDLPPWPAEPVKLDKQVAKRLSGRYALAPGQNGPPGFDAITLVYRDGAMFLEGPGGPPMLLTPTSATAYLIEEAGVQLNVRAGKAGKVEAVVIEQGGIGLEFRPVAADPTK